MNVNFTVFIDKILSGEKRQTIRKASSKWRNVKAGDRLTLYTGLRTKECRKLGEAEVESVDDIHITYITVETNKKTLNKGELMKLAQADGFDCIRDFLEFFNDHYGNNFKGKVIKWKNFRKAE